MQVKPSIEPTHMTFLNKTENTRHAEKVVLPITLCSLKYKPYALQTILFRTGQAALCRGKY